MLLQHSCSRRGVGGGGGGGACVDAVALAVAVTVEVVVGSSGVLIAVVEAKKPWSKAVDISQMLAVASGQRVWQVVACACSSCLHRDEAPETGTVKSADSESTSIYKCRLCHGAHVSYLLGYSSL